jgi:hypothetical protein
VRFCDLFGAGPELSLLVASRSIEGMIPARTDIAAVAQWFLETPRLRPQPWSKAAQDAGEVRQSPLRKAQTHRDNARQA